MWQPQDTKRIYSVEADILQLSQTIGEQEKLLKSILKIGKRHLARPLRRHGDDLVKKVS